VAELLLSETEKLLLAIHEDTVVLRYFARGSVGHSPGGIRLLTNRTVEQRIAPARRR